MASAKTPPCAPQQKEAGVVLPCPKLKMEEFNIVRCFAFHVYAINWLNFHELIIFETTTTINTQLRTLGTGTFGRVKLVQHLPMVRPCMYT